MKPSTPTGQEYPLSTVRLAVDIGGTFTDLVSIDDEGQVSNVKVLTTPDEPSKGFLNAVTEFLNKTGSKPQNIGLIIHATTLASNALLTGNIPRTALVTTKGFRDVLEIGRQNRPELYNLQVERARPLIPRRYRFEIDERVTYDGKVIRKINPQDSRKIVEVIRRSEARSVAISFLHSYANPTHEKAFEEVLKKRVPSVRTTLSSRLLPEFREYERTSTTVVNACLQPVISEYLDRLTMELEERNIHASLYMMQSNGGTIFSRQAIEEPARVIESGPVAGAVAARYYGNLSKVKSVISFDVGGTTSKAGVWTRERFELTTDYEVGGRVHGLRRLEGSGYPVRFPQVDLVEVGTGGGSIAKVDPEGILHVGPESAGANPGPACYANGGKYPTVTDAHVLLNRLSEEHPLAGNLYVKPILAKRAVRKWVADRLGWNIHDSARAILRIAVDNMVRALRAASIERGKDPRGMLLVAFGGAGPMHAVEVAQQLDIRKVLVPPSAGLFSSLGLLLAAPSRDYVQTVMVQMSDAQVNALERQFQRMEKRGLSSLIEQGMRSEIVQFERYLDIRYSGQAYELSIPSPGRLTRHALTVASEKFQKAHKEKYGYSDKTLPLELVNLRVNCSGPTVRLKMARHPIRTKASMGKKRVVTFLEEGRREASIYDRGSLNEGFVGKGPAILEDYDSTLIIPPGTTFNIDRYGSTIVRLL